MTKTDRNLIAIKLECVYSSLNELYDVLMQNQSTNKDLDVKFIIEELADLNPDDELIADLKYLSGQLIDYSRDFKVRK